MVDHTACDSNECIRVFASDLVDSLAAFLVAGVGDGAGVHNEDIGIRICPDDFISRRLEARC